MIELRHLRTLIALKETGSLAGAAAKRFVTQSALSHQIKELETRISSAIFVRKSKPLTFTPEGVRLLQLANDILPKVMETEHELKQGLDDENHQLRVGIECHSCFRWLMPVMAQFREHHSQANLDLSSRHLFDSLNALEAGDLDVVLTSDPVPAQSITYQHLFDFEVKLVIANDHPLANEPFVSPAQLTGLPILSYPVPIQRMDIYRHFLEPAGIKPGPQIHCDLTMMLLQRIACKDGIAALPSWSIKEAHGLSLTSITLGKEGLKRPLFGAYRPHNANSRLAQDWLNLVAKEGANK
ncbi:LysR substrate-binding domain-containing protein [Shewanella surugensis]|uniref:HTH-type transcriptional regulator MetR n=1 Tax=Shewanella surugensis TaxID=212020 RepID=A0ABT0LDG7_9GAMM|nr:LysR substrate-binding domain-containing protein [Shewanella surugensis]MCL1125748.1 LysR substrate-binding domain-containing protein [Shewanella surugensis]